jgi:NAD(P)-dependent dehydrogenase (short-subunit alcohol dehydrogenase family)
MERALIVGASGGIGAALAAHWAGRFEVTGVSRSGDGLDVTDEGAVARVLGAIEPPFARIVVATGILAPEGGAPEKALAQIDAGAMARVLAVDAIGPALALKHAMRLIPRDAPCVVAVLTARVGSIGDNRIGGWTSYRAAKAAANQVLRCAAVEAGRTRKRASLIAYHPGTVATPFTEGYPGHRKIGPAEAAAHLSDVMDAMGPETSGRFYDWRGEEVPW